MSDQTMRMQSISSAILLLAALLMAISLLSAGCGSDGGSSKTGEGEGEGECEGEGETAIAISAKLIAGTQSLPAPPQQPDPSSGDPLAGYQLYCISFANPPAAAAGTADQSGQLSLTLDATGVSLGCFILDLQGAKVASLIFVSGSEMGQTITLSGDTALGTITVDLDSGIAQVGVPATGALSGSTGLPCPLGTWVFEGWPSDCASTAIRSTVWIVQSAAGQYLISYLTGPMITSAGVCGYRSRTDPASYSNSVLTYSETGEPSCPAQTVNGAATFNADCTQLSNAMTFVGCGSCDPGCAGCGSATCSGTEPAVRQ